MKDLVSNRWITIVALVASMSVICTVLAYYGYPGMALAGVGLLLSAGVFLTIPSTSSMSDVLRDVDAEPRLADAVPVRVATAAGPPGSNGKATP
jgi:hypothetical protein